MSAHEPFNTAEAAVQEEADIISKKVAVKLTQRRKLVGDTDTGIVLKERIEELKQLLQAYRDGIIIEQF